MNYFIQNFLVFKIFMNLILFFIPCFIIVLDSKITVAIWEWKSLGPMAYL